MSEVKPCPFCGDDHTGVMNMSTFDEDPPRQWKRVTCRTCGAMAPEPTWNARNDPVLTSAVACLREIAKRKCAVNVEICELHAPSRIASDWLREHGL
jgi:hypothetical protein